MKSVASDIGLLNQRPTRKTKCRKIQPRPWFDTDCERKRKTYFKAKNLARRRHNEHVAQQKQKAASKAYKKQLRLSFMKYQSTFMTKIRNMKSNDPKMFWKLINGSDKEKRDVVVDISCETFKQHFKGLGVTGQPYDSNCNDNKILILEQMMY